MGLHDGHRQRMKERFARHGLDSFAEHEVLELLLYYAIPRRDTNELAHTLLDRFGSLERVLLAPREELMKVPGVGEGAALLLTLVPAVSQYTHRHAPQETILNSVDASGRYFMRLLCHERRELLYQACLDGKGKLLSCRCLCHIRIRCRCRSLDCKAVIICDLNLLDQFFLFFDISFLLPAICCIIIEIILLGVCQRLFLTLRCSFIILGIQSHNIPYGICLYDLLVQCTLVQLS